MEHLAKALVSAQADIKPPKFDSQSTAFGGKVYQYASLAACMDAVRMPLAKNGLVLLQLVENEGDELIVRTRLLHQSGQFIEASQRAHCPAKPQDRGGVTTYLRRYGLNGILGLAAEEDDDAAAAQEAAAQSRKPQAASAEQKPELSPVELATRLEAVRARHRVEQAVAGKAPPTGKGDNAIVGRVERVYLNEGKKPHRIILEDGTDFKAWQRDTELVERLQRGEEYRFVLKRKPGKDGYPDEWFLEDVQVNKAAEVAAEEIPF